MTLVAAREATLAHQIAHSLRGAFVTIPVTRQSRSSPDQTTPGWILLPQVIRAFGWHGRPRSNVLISLLQT
jgi:hypothetical protein